MSGKKVKAEIPEQESQPVAEMQETAGQTSEAVKSALVILAYPGTEDHVARVWDKMTELPFRVVTAGNGSIQDVLASVVADEGTADDFIFIPANVIPCRPVDMDDLSAPYVYTTSGGGRVYAGRVPMKFSKEALVEMLADSEGLDDESFVRGYFDRYRHYPVEVGFKFGNFITPVLRGDPCASVVMEALVRKRFIAASLEGYQAIRSLVDDTLLGGK